MDAFLRRVVEQRDREQVLDDSSRKATLDALTRPRMCRVCGKSVGAPEDHPLTVCRRCGGLRRHLQLEREDADRAAASKREADARTRPQRRRDELLALAGIPPTEEAVMTEEVKLCRQCGKKLRRDNTRGACSQCLAGPQAGGEASRQGGDLKKRFRTVCEALGADPDRLLAEFMTGWLDRIRASARLSISDESED